MANRLYNGITLYNVSRFTQDDRKNYLAQFGKVYHYKATSFIHDHIDDLLTNASEDDNFIYWWNTHLLVD